MPDFIGIDVQGIEEMQKALSELPQAIQDEAVTAVNDYLLKALRLYPPSKYVSRKAAYGTVFFTEKQRRYFFWALKEGIIDVPYKRTQGFGKAWRQVGTGARSFLANESPYAAFLMDDNLQSRHAAMIGWKTISEFIQQRIDKIEKVAEGAVKKALRKLRLE